MPEEAPSKKKKKKKKKDEPEPPSPYDWQPFGAPIAGAVSEGPLASIDLDTLTAMTGGASAWELRLVVRDQNGEQRESRMNMALPVPPAQAPAETGR
jgi:hypothetical protein